MRGGVRIGSIFGIPLSLHVSWFLIAAFLTVALGVSVYPDVLHGYSPTVYWALAVISVLAFFVCIVIHELAHSLVARAYGIPVKGITLFVFGGVSQIGREAARPSQEFVIAVVGPFTSILLSGFFLLAAWLVGMNGDNPGVLMLQWLWIINLMLGFFNLAPGFPMDGGRVVRSILWGISHSYRRATRWASLTGRALAWGMVLFGLVAAVGLVPGVDALNGLWFVVMGMFLESAARQSWQQVELLERLRRITVADIMRRDLPTVSAGATVFQAVGEDPMGWQGVCVFVTDGEKVVGMLTAESAAALPKARWREPVTSAMIATERAVVLDPEVDGATAMETMEEHGTRHLPVVRAGRLLGSVSRDRLLQAALLSRRA